MSRCCRHERILCNGDKLLLRKGLARYPPVSRVIGRPAGTRVVSKRRGSHVSPERATKERARKETIENASIAVNLPIRGSKRAESPRERRERAISGRVSRGRTRVERGLEKKNNERELKFGRGYSP